MESREYDEAHDIEDRGPKPKRISLYMIQKRNLPSAASNYSKEKIVEELNKITHLRLDRENIKEIDNLELLGNNVTNVYLQANLITVIENLECLPNLWFLCLAGNKISKIQGLMHLTKLVFLDLSANKIQKFDIDELPQSLKILDLRGNPCTKLPDYRGRILQDMAKLQQLDGVKVSKEERQESGYVVSSDSDEGECEAVLTENEEEEVEEAQEDTDEIVYTAREKLERFELTGGAENKASLQQATNSILERSQQNLEDSLANHRRRLDMLDALRVEKDLPPSSRREKAPQAKSMGWTPK